MSENQYSWVGVYKQIAKALVEKYKESPAALFDSLRGIGLEIPENGDTVDPFTIFEWLTGGQKRKDAVDSDDMSREGKIGRIWHVLGKSPAELPVTFGFDGLQENVTNWHAFVRMSEAELAKLWDLAETASRGAFDAEVFAECLEIRNIGPVNLTCGLYWLCPDVFIPYASGAIGIVDYLSNNAKEIELRYTDGRTVSVPSGEENAFAVWYPVFLQDVKEKFGEKLYPFVHTAYEWKKNKISASNA